MNHSSLDINCTNCSNISNACSPFDSQEQIDFYRIQFYLIGFGGSCVAIISITFNLFLFFLLFFGRPFFRRTHFFFLGVIAIFDVLHACCYIPFFVVPAIFTYNQDKALYHIWLSYALKLFAVSNIVLFTNTYLILAAAAERYLILHHLNRYCTLKYRIIGVSAILLFALLNRGPIYFELEVIIIESCVDQWYEKTIYPTSVIQWPGYKVFRTSYRSIISVIIPISLLICLNLLIAWQKRLPCLENLVEKWRHDEEMRRKIDTVAFARKSRNFVGTGLYFMRCRLWARRAQQRVKNNARKTIVIIVIEYIIINGLTFLLTWWEITDIKSTIALRNKYTILTDLTSIFSVVAGLIRLPTYYVCAPALRNELRKIFYRLCFVLYPKRAKSGKWNFVFYRIRRWQAANKSSKTSKRRRTLRATFSTNNNCTSNTFSTTLDKTDKEDVFQELQSMV